MFNKVNLSAEEVEEKKSEIWQAIIDNNYEVAFSLATRLDRQAPGSVNYILGMIYFNGYGVGEDYNKAAYYLKNAIMQHDEDEGMSWYFMGMIFLFSDQYEDALSYFKNAEKCGEDAGAMIAQIYASMASNIRAVACRTLKMDEYSQANAMAVSYALDSQEKFFEVIGRDSDSMLIVHWVLMGRMCAMLYNMACRGELVIGVTDTNSFGTYMANSFNIFSGKYDTDSHEIWWNNIVNVCDVMESNGKTIIAEYFRAICSQLDSELHKSAKAFYRAKWHLKRVGELRKDLDSTTLSELTEYMSDVDEGYRRLERKYGSLIRSMILSGELPDISVSYVKGKAPSVASCQNFMYMIEAEKNASAKFQQPYRSDVGLEDKLNGIKNKLFGFLGR